MESVPVRRVAIAVVVVIAATSCRSGGERHAPVGEHPPAGGIVVGGGDGRPLARAVAAGFSPCWPTRDTVWEQVILPRLVDSPPGDLRFCPVTWPAAEAFVAPDPGSEAFAAMDREVEQQVAMARPLLERGWTLSATVATMPRWLSRHPGDDSHHPNDEWDRAWWRAPPAPERYPAWEALVGALARAYASRGVHPWYGVFDEPDWMFYGTAGEYFEYYDRTAAAIKAADPQSRVGGPAVSNFGSPKNVYLPTPDAQGRWRETPRDTWDPSSLLERFLVHVGTSGAPLDFVDFHFAGPSDVGDLVARTRSLLEAAGLPENLPVRIGEWTYAPAGAEAESEASAAYVVAMLEAMADATDRYGTEISHDHTSMLDQSGWADGSWTHVGLVSSTNLLTRPWGVVRPKLNAYALVGLLAGGRDTRRLPLGLPTNDLFVHGLATRRSDGTVGVLLARFTADPATALVVKEAGDLLVERGVLTRREVDRAAADARSDECRAGRLPGAERQAVIVDALRRCTDLTDAQVRAALDAFAEVAARLDEQRARGLTDAVVIPWRGRAGVSVYRIDEDHASACGYNRRTAPAGSVDDENPCGRGGAIDGAARTVNDAGQDAGAAVLAARGWSDAQVEIVRAASKACTAAAETPGDATRCTLAVLAPGGQTDPALPSTARDDLATAYSAARDRAAAEERAVAARLDRRPDVVASAEELGVLEADGGYLRVPVALPPDGTLLLLVRPA